MEERDNELAAIDRVIAAARDGRGAGLLIEGPPGIGKTRLLAAAREADGVHVLSARASELERDFPFAVVRQLLETAPDHLFTGAAALAAPVLRDGASEGDAQALHGLYWLTANLAAEHPLLILVDDAHWADPPSLRWLAYLAQRLDGLPAAVILAARPGEPALDHLATLELLEPHDLSPEAISRMIDGAEPEFITACATVTGGNPFLLGELLRELATVAPTAANAPLVARQSSRTVSRAALARLRRLPAEATALAHAVVILGDGAEPAAAATFAHLELEAASSAADALERAGILAPARQLAFIHPLVRESIYADLSAAERARGHARAAGLVADIERAAIHHHAADPAGDQEAVRVLLEASRSARRRGATEVAISHLRRALLEPPADPREVKRELGSAELQAGNYDAAVELLEEEDAAELGAALQMANRGEEAVRALTRAIDALPDEERELGLHLQAIRGAASQTDLQAAATARAAGIRFRGPKGEPTTPGERMFIAGLAYREAMTGDAAKAKQLALKALPLLDDPGPSVPAVYGAPLALLFSGALVEATEAFTKIIDWAQVHGSFLAFVQASHLRAGVWWRRGNLAEAEADAANAADHGSFMVRPGALALIEIALVQDDVDRAEQLWRAYELDEDPLTSRASVATRQLRARLKAARGGDALDELRRCGEHEQAWGIRNPTHSTWRSDAVRLGATELADENIAQARAFGDPRAIGIALRAAGQTEQAIQVLRDSPARLELALALHEHGAALRRAGQRVAAREPLAEATQLAATLSATALAAKAHDELVAAGARPRRDPIESRTHLTASETRVAKMAADGMTNKEIAQALFLTEKTIEVHLTSTYRKLDIRSRSQLPRALGERLG